MRDLEPEYLDGERDVTGAVIDPDPRAVYDALAHLGYFAEACPRTPYSPWFSVLRRLTFPPPTLLLRRMEIQTLSLLGELRAAGNWTTLAAECSADRSPQNLLGREDAAFFQRRSS